MKEIKRPNPVWGARSAFATLLLVVAWGLTGCTVMKVGALVEKPANRIKKGVTTKQQVYQILGAPSTIEYDAEDRILIYAAAQGKGLGFGITLDPVHENASMLKIIAVSDIRVGTDTIAVRVGPNDRVVSVTRSAGTQNAKYRLWPFGA